MEFVGKLCTLFIYTIKFYIDCTPSKAPLGSPKAPLRHIPILETVMKVILSAHSGDFLSMQLLLYGGIFPRIVLPSPQLWERGRRLSQICYGI